MSTAASFFPVSFTVTVAVAAAPAAVGVPEITPVPGSISSPAGRPAAPYASMSAPLDGLICVIGLPTFSEPGAV